MKVLLVGSCTLKLISTLALRCKHPIILADHSGNLSRISIFEWKNKTNEGSTASSSTGLGWPRGNRRAV